MSSPQPKRNHCYPEIEASVLGSIMNESFQHLATKIFRILPTEAFSLVKFEHTYKFLKTELENGKKTFHEIVLAYSETNIIDLDKNEKPEIRQSQAMIEIGNFSKRSHLFEVYLMRDVVVLIQAHLHRTIQEKALDIANDTGSVEGMEVIREKLVSMQKFLQQPSGDIEELFSSEQIRQTIEQMEAANKNKTFITGLDTGYQYLNEFTSGFQAGEFILLAGRPGMGKSTLAVNMCNLISKKGKAVVWFNYESTGIEIRKKLFSINTKFEYQSIRSGKLEKDQWAVINKVAGEMSERKLAVLDYGNVTIEQLENIAYSITRRYEIGLFVLDFLQLAPIGTKSILNAFENAQVQHVSRTLKRIAKETGVPVLAISQLNRKVEERYDKRPQLSDLRGSGSLEQDADVVMMCYRPCYYDGLDFDENGNSLEGQAELIICKNKNGVTGSILFETNLERCTFTESEKDKTLSLKKGYSKTDTKDPPF